eukprot:GEMP01052681.1.p1 GENE.GEMP01052681.1~~GEMP01052681.1.p1  ORF type:complete len:219 (+),score=37.24 GEMP01052681.1:149-805(+)
MAPTDYATLRRRHYDAQMLDTSEQYLPLQKPPRTAGLQTRGFEFKYAPTPNITRVQTAPPSFSDIPDVNAATISNTGQIFHSKTASLNAWYNRWAAPYFEKDAFSELQKAHPAGQTLGESRRHHVTSTSVPYENLHPRGEPPGLGVWIYDSRRRVDKHFRHPSHMIQCVSGSPTLKSDSKPNLARAGSSFRDGFGASVISTRDGPRKLGGNCKTNLRK